MMKRTLAKEWLSAAKDDLMTIMAILNNEHLTNIVAFHAQQSIEKSLKSILEYNGETIPRKHDLLVLSALTSRYLTLNDIKLLDTLNDLYTESRYPGDLGLLPNGKPSIDDAKGFYEFARDVYESVNSLLCE